MSTPIEHRIHQRRLSDRKKTGEVLRESDERFRIMADTAPVMIWMSGQDKLCNYFNKRWLEFTGRALEQELGNGWTEGVHPDDFQYCLKVYETAFDARQDFKMEYRLRRSDGDYRWILDHGTQRYLPDGSFAGYIGSCIDITDRKHSEDRFRLVVEAAPNAMIVVNSKGEIVLANAQVEMIFGYTRQELVGRPVEVLVPERFHPHHPGHRSGYIADSRARKLGAGRDLFGRRKDGSEVLLEISLNPIRISEELFVLVSIIDITERKRVELETIRQHNELAHLSRVMIAGELSVSLAHEINQPLTAILSNAQAAQRFLDYTTPDLDEIRNILQDIVEDDRRAGEIIRRLRLMLKKGETQQQLLDVNDLMQEVLKLMRSDLMNHNVSASVEFEPTLPAVRGDRVQLQQVLVNLIMNACHAMTDAAPVDRRIIVRTARSGEKEVYISVVDYGRGIPPEDMERIFEPFFSTRSDGLGLGLAVCRRIIGIHGGKLWAANNSERGASFHFTVPADPEGAA